VLKTTLKIFVLIVVLGCGASPAQDSSGPQPKRARAPEDYRPRTLKEVAAQSSDADGRGDKEETTLVLGDILPSRVRVAYAGTSRPLSEIKREVLRQWAVRFAGVPEGYTKPYEREMLFTENGARYWLAVRKESLPRLRQELKRGEAVDLYLIRLGAAKTPGGWEPLLLVESFRKPN
jgi:hypothetical protein